MPNFHSDLFFFLPPGRRRPPPWERSQYVVGLRDEVCRLRDRRTECQEENQLLRQLHGLWRCLVGEVEKELQDGVREQLGLKQEGGDGEAAATEAGTASAASSSVTSPPPAPSSSPSTAPPAPTIVVLQPRKKARATATAATTRETGSIKQSS